MTAEEVMTFLAGLAGLRPPWYLQLVQQPTVSFETVATAGRITHYLLMPGGLQARVLSHLQAALPSIRPTAVESVPKPTVQTATELRLSTTTRPLRSDRPAGASAALLTSLLPLEENEQVVVSWTISPTRVPKPPRLPSNGDRTTELLESDTYAISPHGEAMRAETRKQVELPFVVVGRVGVHAEHPLRRFKLLERTETAFRMLNAPGVHLEAKRFIPSRVIAERMNERKVPLFNWPAWLNGAEVVNVIGWPIGATQLPGVDLGGCRQLPPAIDIPSEGYVIGRATFPGNERPLAIGERDRELHLSITGPTGSGKSNLLTNLIVSDLENGRGCVVVDVKGDLVNDVLDRVPDDRVDDVIVVDPSDLERPVGLNFLGTEFASKELVADEVTATFHLLFENFWGPRSDDLLRASILTLMRDPASTLVELVPLLTSTTFRKKFVDMVKGDTIGLGPFWSTYSALRPNEQAQVISPVMNKLRQILLRPAVRNCVGQSRTKLDFREAINSNKVVLLRLPEGLLGDEAASLLGSLLVSRVWSAAQGRVGQEGAERTPCALYIDEAHRLVGSAISLDNMLAQARAVRLSVVLATQHLTQYASPELRKAVLSNARSKVIFQPTADDARLYEKELRPYLTAEDLQGLGQYEIVAQLAANQRVLAPATAVTLPTSLPTGNAERCRLRSRERYGRDRQVIEDEMQQRHATATNSAPIGRQKKGGTS
jgi:hypothetical protein